MAPHDEDPDTEQIIERLAERFPDSPAEHVRDVVDREEERFADAPVRDFVPVLVEREARDELRGEGYEDEGPGSVVIIPESEKDRDEAGRQEMEDIEEGEASEYQLEEGRGIPEESARESAARAEALYGALGTGGVVDAEPA